MNRQEFNVSRWRFALFSLVLAGLVALGIALLVQGKEDPWVGWGLIAFFGFMLLACLRQMFDPRPRLAVDGKGIEDRALGVGVIAWTDIVSAEAFSVSNTHFVALNVRDPEIYLARMSWLKALLSRSNRVIGVPPLAIQITALALDRAALLQLIQQNARGQPGSPAVTR